MNAIPNAKFAAGSRVQLIVNGFEVLSITVSPKDIDSEEFKAIIDYILFVKNRVRIN